ncbi:MAG: transposase, partial [candidate division KSB1 bacterium]|nr:transposase [candidate division KSB1 bacterium]
KLPPGIKKKFFRGDSAFFDKKLVNFLELNRVGYAIVARRTKPIKSRLGGLKYKRISPHIAVAEFYYQPYGWDHRGRFVVIRREVPEEPSQQLSLFKMGKYTYQVIVTNLKLNPVKVWRFYNRRATGELIIRELKEGYATGKIPTKFFKANSAFFQLTLLAYDLFIWFKRLCLPEKYRRMTVESLRHRLLAVPAELVYPHGKAVLKFSEEYPDKAAFIETLKNIQKIRI